MFLMLLKLTHYPGSSSEHGQGHVVSSQGVAPDQGRQSNSESGMAQRYGR